MLRIKEVEMVDFWRNWSLRDAFREGIFRIWDAGREDFFCSEQDHAEFQFQEEWWPVDRFIIYDYFRVTGAQDTVLDIADLFSDTLRDENAQDSIQDGKKF